LKRGDLISPVALTAEGVIDPPSSHQVWFRGEKPHGQGGRELYIAVRDNRLEVTPDLIAQFSFSAKLLDRNGQKRDYVSFEEKMQTYLDFLTAPALAEYPGATPFTGIGVKAAAQKSPLRFPDTSSANYNLNDISSLLRGKKIAIVGLGGTGSYILDFLARTHLERIALFDDDKVHVHTIFRTPGFIPNAIGKKKVEALYQLYANWHDGIEAIDERITEKNIERLLEFDFVFVSVDDGPARRLMVDWLSAKSVRLQIAGWGSIGRLWD
jgi:hypothetical protein